MKPRSQIVASILAVTLALASTSPAEEAAVTVEASASGTALTGSVTIPTDPMAVWAVLTNYDALPTFVPVLESSRVVERRSDRVFVIEQTSIGRFAIFKRLSRAKFESHHTPAERITTTFIDGDFHHHEIEWQLAPSIGTTQLRYRAVIRSIHRAPQWIVNRIARKAVEQTQIGIVDNFHFRSLHSPLEPLVMYLAPKGDLWDLYVRVSPENFGATLAYVLTKWRSVTDNSPFEWEFLDARIQRQYESELRWGRIVLYATTFALLVACLGVFGLTAQAVVRRTKEIGIRKVLGAMSGQTVALFSRDFLVMVIIGNLIAVPLAYRFATAWLENFAYRIDLGPGLFIGGLCLTAATAMGTVAIQAFRAARANPVDALRHE